MKSIQGTYVARMVVVQGRVEWHSPQGLCHKLCSVVAMCDTQDACVVSCSFYIILVVICIKAHTSVSYTHYLTSL